MTTRQKRRDSMEAAWDHHAGPGTPQWLTVYVLPYAAKREPMENRLT